MPSGPAGPQGDIDPAVTTSSAYAANTQGSLISVIIGCAEVILPDNIYAGLDMSVDAISEALTLTNTGIHLLAYRVSVTATALLGIRLLNNGVVIEESEVVAAVSVKTIAMKSYFL